MTPDPAPTEEAGEPECGFGRCDPAHVLHCCHTAYGTREAAGPRGVVLHGWKCAFCPKESKVKVLRKVGR